MGNSGKVLVDVKGGNNLLYLPLDRIGNRGSNAQMDDALEQIQRMNSTQSGSRSNLANQLRDNVRRRETR